MLDAATVDEYLYIPHKCLPCKCFVQFPAAVVPDPRCPAAFAVRFSSAVGSYRLQRHLHTTATYHAKQQLPQIFTSEKFNRTRQGLTG